MATTAKPSAEVTTVAVSAWAFLLAAMDIWAVNHKSWKELVFNLLSCMFHMIELLVEEA